MTRSNAMWIVKGYWAKANLDPDAFIATRSLRVGAATESYRQGMPVDEIQRLLGHVSPATTQLYIRTNTAWMHQLVLTI